MPAEALSTNVPARDGATADLAGTVLDGKFELAKALASGAGGDVYEAMHLGLGARVAVKVLRPGIPETAGIRRKRFMREARVAAGLKSEHVVRIYDIVAPDHGPTYIVMELLQGETLADRVRRGVLPVNDAVDFVLQAAKPLGEMHVEGIVHRDVKPSNLFLARDADGKERIKLLDFGVAAFQQPVARADSSLTLSEVVVGTPRYMAPEQVQASKKVDARADVWALGVTLYELLAGRAPFDGQTVLAVLNQIEHQEPPRLATLRPEVPVALADVVHACLSKDPAGRPADARALARALGDALIPPTASPGAPRARGKLWAAAAGLVLLLVAGAIALIHGAAEPPVEPAPAISAPLTASIPPSATAALTASATVVAPAMPSTAAATSSEATPARPTASQRHTPPHSRSPQPTPPPRTARPDDDRIE